MIIISFRQQAKTITEFFICQMDILRGSYGQRSGVLIYKSVFDFNVTIAQPGEDDFMGRTTFTMSNFVSVRFAQAKNFSHFFSSPKDDFHGTNLVSSIS